MKNLKFEIYYNTEEPKNEYQPKVGQKMAHIYWRDQIDNFVVQQDKYGEYIMVPNYLNPMNDEWAQYFSRRIQDAVQSIRNGDGDCIEMDRMFGFNNIYVHFYLDRNIGESLRAKSIEGFKNSKFETVIYMPSPFGCYLYENECLTSPVFAENLKKMVFNSEEEALAEIEKIYAEAEKIISEKRYEMDSFPETELERTALMFITEKEIGELKIRKDLEVAQDIKKED